MTIDGLVINVGAKGWLVQGECQLGDRHFYYKCRGGTQWVVELDPKKLDEMWELQHTCLCDALGGSHAYETYSGSKLCEHVWSEDDFFHKRIFKICLQHLLKQEIRL